MICHGCHLMKQVDALSQKEQYHILPFRLVLLSFPPALKLISLIWFLLIPALPVQEIFFLKQIFFIFRHFLYLSNRENMPIIVINAVRKQ